MSLQDKMILYRFDIVTSRKSSLNDVNISCIKKKETNGKGKKRPTNFQKLFSKITDLQQSRNVFPHL